MAESKPELTLPVDLISPSEIKKLIRELNSLSDYLTQASIREAGAKSSLALPRSSRLLEELANLNKLNFIRQPDCRAASLFLQRVNEQAPLVHLSFASDPSAAFVQEIGRWFRSNIHPFTLINIGLEPSIAAGCVLRTANKQFDFSLRNHFVQQRNLLIKLLRPLPEAASQ